MDNCWQWNELDGLVLHQHCLGGISSDVKIRSLIAFGNSPVISPGGIWWSHSCSQWASKTRPINNSQGWANRHWSLQKNFSRGWMKSLGLLFSYSAETCNDMGYSDALSGGTWALLSHSGIYGNVCSREKILNQTFICQRWFQKLIPRHMVFRKPF